MSPHFGPNLVTDVQQMLALHFMLNALRAGTVVAVLAGTIGWLMVARSQAFVGHTLAVVGFPGAAGAALLGAGATAGYYGVCVLAALVLGLGRGGDSATRAGESALVGTVQALALACGLLFVSLSRGLLSGITGLLFGSITGVTDTQVLVLVAVAAGCLVVLTVIGRPLLFASVDPEVARTRGVPVRTLSAAYLAVLGVTAAGASQVTGSLLVFALLITPAATAARLTCRSAPGVALSVGLALAVVWGGETLAFFTVYPIGFWVSSLAFLAWLAAAGLTRMRAPASSRHA